MKQLLTALSPLDEPHISANGEIEITSKAPGLEGITQKLPKKLCPFRHF
jgi:hypothetical protein